MRKSWQYQLAVTFAKASAYAMPTADETADRAVSKPLRLGETPRPTRFARANYLIRRR